MTALETANASESTALALAKATENIAATNTATIDTNLRLLNLEKALKRQEQRTNEITNTNRKAKAQKNFSGSQFSEPLASPVKQALKQQKRRIVDLTQSDSNDAEIWKPQGTPKTKNLKQNRKTRPQPDNSNKSIKWKTAEIHQFNPTSPTKQQPSPPQESNIIQPPPTVTSIPSHTPATGFHTAGSFYPPQPYMPMLYGLPAQATCINGAPLINPYYPQQQAPGFMYNIPPQLFQDTPPQQVQVQNPFPQVPKHLLKPSPFGTLPRQQ
jgi:hypothetical protein